MIRGAVSDDREALIRLNVLGLLRREQEVEAVIDTGFDGYLTLPQEVVEILGLPWRSFGRAFLADGSQSVFDVHEGTVIWDGKPRQIAIGAVNTSPLVGMGLLDGYELTMKVTPGGLVTVETLR